MEPNKSRTILGIIVGLLVIVVLILVLKPKPSVAPIDNNPAPVTDGHENEKDNENSYPDTFTQELKYGMDGNAEVRTLQAYLIAEGYLQGTPNGSFYTATQAAVKKFQQAKGLPQTGVVDLQTRAVLNAIFTGKPPVVTAACPGIQITSPISGSQVSFPLTISGIIHPTGTVFPPNPWIVFEGEAGTVTVNNAAGTVISPMKLLTLSVDWMNTDPKPFSVTIPNLSQVPNNPNITLNFVDNQQQDGAPSHTCSVPVHL